MWHYSRTFSMCCFDSLSQPMLGLSFFSRNAPQDHARNDKQVQFKLLKNAKEVIEPRQESSLRDSIRGSYYQNLLTAMPILLNEEID